MSKQKSDKIKWRKLDDTTWRRVEKVLRNDKQTWRGKAQSKRDFIDDVLYLLSQKKQFSVRMNWSSLFDEKEAHSQRRRFNRWRNEGTWAKILPILIRTKDYAWVSRMGLFEVFFDNSKTLSDINQKVCKRYTKRARNRRKELMDDLRTCIDELKKLDRDSKNKELQHEKEIKKVNEKCNKLIIKNQQQHDELVAYHRKYGLLNKSY